jgi:ribonuclease HI
VTYDQFRERIDFKKTMLIETDGECAENQGPFGAERGMKVEAFGAEGSTSNNEMELRAIDEELGLFKNVKSYAMIESDSERCLATMMGRGEQWEADNYIRFNGEAVKNRDLVPSITAKLRMINVEFRKAKCNNNDQWNDSAEALAVQGRDDSINWPRCSFDIIIPERTIAFRERAMRDFRTLAKVYAELKRETEERSPAVRDIKLFKNGNSYAGNWTAGLYQLVYRSLPAPAPAPAAAAATGPIAPKHKPAVFGIWDGKKLKPIPPIDISVVSEEERLRTFNSVHQIGREVRYFVSNAEEEAALLEPGQPHSVYPKKFARSGRPRSRSRIR